MSSQPRSMWLGTHPGDDRSTVETSMSKKKAQTRQRPPQRQRTQPGRQSKMRPQPMVDDPQDHGGDKLTGKVALITGGDSGIGEAVAITFAKQQADIAIIYLEEHDDARNARDAVE